MENKLIPMTTFVAEQWLNKLTTKQQLDNIYNYSLFLKQQLEIGFFIPCENNVPLEKPLNYDIWEELEYNDGKGNGTISFEGHKKYKQDKSRVLFEDAIKIDRSPYKCTKRLLIDLAVDTPFRIYTELRYPDGNIERNEFPNPKKPNMTIEDLVEYNLTLTETAIKSIYGS
ncbi:hypothetical protein [Elizabethkingia sp. 2-6]|uniref:hypothetical protein n=1 Tax=Elizabethkingia sp. 2-6 TaxID=2575699 RepID=UPI0010C173C7|nr:hypothetical protein [Elizabethkingia sp. 2-6]QCO45822.1 hypothetical protein FCS00_05340 [Elizabethkingia sp. 2-6]